MKIETQIKIFILLAILAAIAAQVAVGPPSARSSLSSIAAATQDSSKAPSTDPLCPYGCPTSSKAKETIVVHHILELGNNPDTKFADWVVYKITSATLGHGCKRTWEQDPALSPDRTLSPSDYKGIRAALQSDRGHQAPLASLCGSPYWQEADYLSNITPQKSALNEGPWEHLEAAERMLVTRDGDEVYSLTGPFYERQMERLPNAHLDHVVPSGYWKVVTIREHGGIEFAAFAMDQDMDKEADFCGTTVSLTSIERRTALTFFPALAPSEKARDQDENSKSLMRALGC